LSNLPASTIVDSYATLYTLYTNGHEASHNMTATAASRDISTSLYILNTIPEI